MRYFYALVQQDAGSAFGINFPDLPGCFSAADDMNDVLPQACDALALWFEDAPEAQPMHLDQVQAACAGDLAAGGFLIAVPYIRSTAKVERVNVSFERGMLDAIDRAAAERHLSRSAFLAEAARSVIEHRAFA